MLVIVLTERRSTIEYYVCMKYTGNLGGVVSLVRELGERNLGEEFV